MSLTPASTTKPQAAILAIGTEITSGQIVNSNAAWLAQQLESMGIPTRVHMAVPDERDLMMQALKTCESQAHILFIMGGLGPTTDDFTREVVAQWLAKPLVFHEPAWQHIEERMSRLQMPLVDSQKQQCYFPAGAIPIANAHGTAWAFFCENRQAAVWVLPGPPGEIKGLWEDTLQADLGQRYPGFKPLHPRKWACTGQPESVLADLTEAALQGSGLAIGYRAHFPYVEVKVWVPQEQEAAAIPYLAQLETALKPYVLTRDDEDLALNFLRALPLPGPIRILDLTTQGLLAQRLATPWQQSEQGPLLEIVSLLAPANDQPADEVLLAHLASPTLAPLTLAVVASTDHWAVGYRASEAIRFEIFGYPYQRLAQGERLRRFITEMALWQWVQLLTAGPPMVSA